MDDPLLDQEQHIAGTAGRSAAAGWRLVRRTDLVPFRLGLEHEPVVEESLFTLEAPPHVVVDTGLEGSDEVVLAEIAQSDLPGVIPERRDDLLGLVLIDHGHVPERVVDDREEEDDETEDGDGQHDEKAHPNDEAAPCPLAQQGEVLIPAREVILPDPLGCLEGHSYSCRNRLTMRRLRELRASVMRKRVSPMAKIEL